MDSILNNTSWAFIQGLGYQIKQFIPHFTSKLSHGDANLYPLNLGGSFITAFIDIVCITKDLQYNTIAWTIKPILIKGTTTSNTRLASMWVIMDSTNNSTWFPVPYPEACKNINGTNYLPNYYSITNQTNLVLKSTINGSSAVNVDMSVHVYIVE